MEQTFPKRTFPSTFQKPISSKPATSFSNKDFMLTPQPERKLNSHQKDYRTSNIHQSAKAPLNNDSFGIAPNNTSFNSRSADRYSLEPATRASNRSSQEGGEVIYQAKNQQATFDSYKPSPTIDSAFKNPTKYQRNLQSTAYKTPITKDNNDNQTPGSELQSTRKKGAFSEILQSTGDNKRRSELEMEMEEEVDEEEDNQESEDRRSMIIGLAVPDTKKVRKRYDLLEDWRILESVERYVKDNGASGVFSINNWNKMVDPGTGRRILVGERTVESLRTRYMKFLKYFTPADLEALREFAKAHSVEDMRLYNCFLIKQNGKSLPSSPRSVQSLNANKALNFKSHGGNNIDSTPIIENEILTPRFEAFLHSGENSNLTFANKFSSIKRKEPVHEEEEQEEQEEEEKEEPVEDQRRFSRGRDSLVSRVSRESFVNMDMAQKYPQDESGRKRQLPLSAFDETLIRDSSLGKISKDRKKVKSDIYSLPKASEKYFDYPMTFDPNRKSFVDLQGSQEEETQRKTGSLDSENAMNTEVDNTIPESQRQGTTQDFTLEGMLKTKDLPLEKINPEIMIYVDYEQGFREFTLPEVPAKETKLKALAEEYGLQLKRALKLYHAVSDSYEDLIKYLRSGDERLLWTPKDDHGLLFEDPTVMYYLDKMRGRENIEKRKSYLVGLSQSQKGQGGWGVSSLESDCC